MPLNTSRNKSKNGHPQKNSQTPKFLLHSKRVQSMNKPESDHYRLASIKKRTKQIIKTGKNPNNTLTIIGRIKSNNHLKRHLDIDRMIDVSFHKAPIGIIGRTKDNNKMNINSMTDENRKNKLSIEKKLRTC